MSPFVLLLILGALLNAALVLYGCILLDRRRRQRADRLARASGIRAKQEAETRRHPPRRPRRDAKMSGPVAAITRQLDQSALRLGVNELLVQAGIAMLALYAGSVLGLGMHPLIALPVAVGLAAFGVILLLRVACQRYRSDFVAGLPEALDVFARGLRAGRPLSDSMGIVVESAQGAVQREFARCHDEICLGTPLSEALDRLSTRLPLPEVNFFAVATALQAETGGNLIETMENLATQLRERRKLRKKALALSSEARASAAILASLPFAVAGLIVVLNASYLIPLYADPRGQVMAAAAVLSIALGVFVMMRLGKLDV